MISSSLNKINLMSNDLSATDEDENITDDFILIGSFVAVPAGSYSMVYPNIS